MIMNELVKIKGIIRAVYIRNRRTTLRAYPYSFMIARVLGSAIAIAADLVIYYFVFQKELSIEFIEAAGTSDYVTYLILGQAMSILSFSTLMNVGRCLIGEIREGTIDNLVLSPASRIGYFIGAYLEQLGRSFIEILFILLIGLILGVRIPVTSIPDCIIIVIIASLSFFSVAIFVSTIMIYTRDTYLVQNTIFLAMEFVCGVLYPISFMPLMLQEISKAFPLTYVLILFRKCIMGGESIRSNGELVLITFVLSVIYIVTGYLLYKKIERKLIEEVLA